jgi:ribosome-binding factor A
MDKGNGYRTRSRERERDRDRDEHGRTARLKELIREELNFLLRSEVSDPRLDGVVVTIVDLTGDGSCARVWFAAQTEGEQMEALDGAAGFLRNHLAESLGLKRTPELRFRRDRATRAFDEE